MLLDPSVRERLSRKLALSLAHGVLLAGLASCASVSPDYSQPEIEVPAAWQRAGDSGVAAPGTEDLSHWWVRLQDPVLSGLIEEALAGSLDLRSAQARLRQARALRSLAGGERFPTVSAGGAANRAKSSEESDSGRTIELYSAGFDANWEVDVVVMPLRTVQRRLTGTQDVGSILASVRAGSSIDSARNQVSVIMRERRRISEGEEDDFSVLDTRQIAETLTGTTQIMTSLLGAVAAVSLLVGGIGIMNIMLLSVTERTREIGIRLAIGAIERDVLLQFLLEAVVLASLGGLVGIALASGASIILGRAMQVSYRFDPTTNLLAFLFSAAIGVIFGYFPARRAVRLDPIEALRHE